MPNLSQEIVDFFQQQGFVIITTVDKSGSPHNSCKGIVDIDKNGKVYLLDLYMQNTYANLKINPRMSVTAVNEHKFKGYSLNGFAELIPKEKLSPELDRLWEAKIASRISQRVIKNMLEEKGHPHHPEALFPTPAYMIVLNVEEVVDLRPRHLITE